MDDHDAGDDHGAWLANELRQWPPMPSMPVSVERIDWPASAFVAKCGGELEFGDGVVVRMGGFGLRATAQEAELVARCELVERLLAVTAVADLLSDRRLYAGVEAPARFRSHLRWRSSGPPRARPEEREFPPTDVLISKDGADSHGLGFGRTSLRAGRHAALEALERALFGALWYEGSLGLVEIADEDDLTRRVRTRAFQVASEEHLLPLTLVVMTSPLIPGIYCGLALRGSTERARRAAEQEATMLIADAHQAHAARLQGGAPHDRVLRIREPEVLVACEELLARRRLDDPARRAAIRPADAPFSSLVTACLRALASPGAEVSLWLVPIVRAPGLAVQRAVLEGTPSLSSWRRTAVGVVRDPIA